MRRVIQRKTTTIKIVSVTLTWSDEVETKDTASQPEVPELPASNPETSPAEGKSGPDEQQPKEENS
jgi:hypothetical protein